MLRPPSRIGMENNSLSVAIIDESSSIGINFSVSNLSKGNMNTSIPSIVRRIFTFCLLIYVRLFVEYSPFVC